MFLKLISTTSKDNISAVINAKLRNIYPFKLKICYIKDFFEQNTIHQLNVTTELNQHFSTIRNSNAMFGTKDLLNRSKKIQRIAYVALLSIIHLEVCVLERKQNLPARYAELGMVSSSIGEESTVSFFCLLRNAMRLSI